MDLKNWTEFLRVELLAFALSTLRKGDTSLYGLERVEIAGEDGRELSMNIVTREVQNSKSLIYQLLDAAYSLLPNAYIWWRNFDLFFYLLSFIANSGVEEKIYMINSGFVGELVKFSWPTK
ncbi:7192_t:CDS:2 [Paraglomus brasilianum]|uniref:7192_t:CDS:1 n=1 Tax=Paraglomus brasilianum TaxID=144538 RepID=A0A9N9H291_9GLOM|nr:7192_t:CDS:2 [Paraglomus brasilianum]